MWTLPAKLQTSLFGTEIARYSPPEASSIQSTPSTAQPSVDSSFSPVLACVPLVTMPKHRSPAKKLRSLRRLIAFHQNKSKSIKVPRLAICNQEAYSFQPIGPTLSLDTLPSISIPGKLKPQRPNLKTFLTSNTCDGPECRGRKRPCYAINPATQFYDDSCYSNFR